MPPAKEPVPQPARRRGWRIFLVTFKWCRISLLLLLLVIIVLGLFLNHVGLPDWLERRVEDQFRANGWEMKFSRLRLRWYHGIVAEDLQLQRTNMFNSPHLFLQAAEFRLNWKALRRLDLEASGMTLKGGHLRWPLPGTNQPQRTLSLDEIGGELVFQRGDQWELKFLETQLLGAHVSFRGDVTNASLIREWKFPAPRPRPEVAPGDFWHHLLATVEKIHFEGTPELNVVFHGDARDWQSFETQLRFTALAADSPWGAGTNLSFTANLLPPPRSNDTIRIDLKLTAGHASNQWASASGLNLTTVLEPSFTQLLPTNSLAVIELKDAQTALGRADRLFVELRSNPTRTNAALHETRMDITLEGVTTPDGTAERARGTATAIHAATNSLPASLDTAWTLHEAHTLWVTSRWTQVTARLELPALTELHVTETNRPWSERLRNVPATASATFSNGTAFAFPFEQAGLKARWRFPLVELDTDARLPSGTANAAVSLDAETREATFRGQAQPDLPTLAPLLGAEAGRWLDEVRFESPPRLRAEGSFILPAWTNRQPEWKSEVFPTLALAGQFDSDSGSTRGVPFVSIHAPFVLTNLIWTTAGLKIARPEGALDVSGATDQRTGEFRGAVGCTIDPMALRPAFPQAEAQAVFDYFEFSTPPHLAAELRGNWNDPGRFNASGHLAITNVVFRGQSLKACLARVSYTNQFISVIEPMVFREGEQAMAAGLGIDLAKPRLYLTNAVGRMTPRVVTKAIGPQADRAIAPFIFDLPPDARAEGSVPLGANDKTEDMRFEVSGGPFHWQRFNLDLVKATVIWRRGTLTITNLQGKWRGADVAGAVRIEFTPKGQGDLLSFHVRVDHGDLRAVLRDLQDKKNSQVEGTFGGDLFITRAVTDDWKSWQGGGRAHLTNGLLWDLPLFGVFSPVLNTILPGLGNSRARDAATEFTISNSVIHAKELEIRATAMRMNYRGWVDFDQRVDGRMEAEMLRDVPAIGFLISKVFWPVTKLFEYKITGTLEKPRTEELFIVSRILFMPLHPIKTIRDLFRIGESPPPAAPDKPAPAPPETPK